MHIAVNDDAAHVCELLRTQQGSPNCPELGRGRTWCVNTLSLEGCPSTTSLVGTRGTIYYSKHQPVCLIWVSLPNYQQ